MTRAVVAVVLHLAGRLWDEVADEVTSIYTR